MEAAPVPALNSIDSDVDSELVEIRHGFQLSGFRLLVAKGVYSELISRPNICMIPGTPRGFMGFINHRGETVPIFSVQCMMEPDYEAKEKWLLILGRGETALGILLADYPRGMSEIEPVSEVPQRPSNSIGRFCGAAFRHQNDLWFEFDHLTFGEYAKQEFERTLAGGA